jgi:hypothetical protein
VRDEREERIIPRRLRLPLERAEKREWVSEREKIRQTRM